MKIFHRILSVLFCAALLVGFCLFPAGASADFQTLEPRLPSYVYFLRATDAAPECYELGRFGYNAVVGLNGDYVSADPDLLQALALLVQRYDLEAWDGFSGYDPDVLDGESFSLTIQFADGGEISANGSNAFPPDYAAASHELAALLQTAYEEGKLAADSANFPQTVDLYFPSNPSTGFTWLWEVEDEGIVQVTEQFFGEDSLLPQVGDGGTHWFHFAGLSEGVTSVTLTYARPWENEGAVYRFVFRLQVTPALDVEIWGVEMA